MTETRPHDVAAIKGVLESHYKAWDAGDADAFVTDYATDATVIMPGIYRKSREEVRQGMAEGFASFLKGSTAVDKLGTIRFLGEDAAVAVSEAGIRFPGRDRGSRRPHGVRDLGTGKAWRDLAGRGVPQQPGRPAELTPGPAGSRSVVPGSAR